MARAYDQRVIHADPPAECDAADHEPPTWNVKLPCVVWVSTESACQLTRYVPGASGFDCNAHHVAADLRLTLINSSAVGSCFLDCG